MRRSGLIGLLIVAVGWCFPAFAQPPKGCLEFCTQERNTFLSDCRTTDPCRDVAARGYRHCVEGCGERLDDISHDITYGIALSEAEKTLGQTARLIHWASYTNSGEETSRLYVFSTESSNVTLRSILKSLEEGSEPESFDDMILSVETGVNEHAPPKIAFWTGLPLEIRRLQAMAEWTPVNSQNFSKAIQSRHGGALFPSLQLVDHKGESLLFDARNGVPKEDYRATLSYRPATPGSRRSHLIRRHWLYEMDQLKVEVER